MTALKWVVVLLVIGFVFVSALAYVFQRSLMYFPERLRTPPAAAGLPAAREVTLDTADGERLVAWHVPPRDGRPLVLYFHGNGGSLRYRVERFRVLTAAGFGLLALSYRGYGGSTGTPTEPGLIADALAAYRFATAQLPAERIAIWGESLGAGVGIALAAEHKVGRLVLEAPFHSAVEIGARVYWYLPVRLLMWDQFRSDQRIGRVTTPILILHGTADAVVPIASGEQLYAQANEPKRMVRFPGGGHNNLDAFGASATALKFLAEVPAVRF